MPDKHAANRPGIVRVFCEIHSHMSAVVRIFDHRWFTVPNEDGTYTIDDVPPGDHTLVVFREPVSGRCDANATVRVPERRPADSHALA